MNVKTITSNYKYLYPILCLIPLNFIIFSNGFGRGVQWAFFRYQVTLLGSNSSYNFIPITRDLGYIISGIITGKSAISGISLIMAAVCLGIAFILLLLSNHTIAIKLAGLITILSGVLLAASSIIQYGILFHSNAGVSIPVGIPLLMVTGALMVKFSTPDQAIAGLVNFLKKYDLIVLFFGIFFIYFMVSIPITTNDVIPTQLLPYYILHDHTIFLDQATAYTDNPAYSFRFMEVSGGHYASLPSIVTPILILPLYVIPISLLNIPMTDLILLFMGKTSAALISALAGICIYLTCKKLTTPNLALISALIFAFATSTWSISSQALWAHGVVELLLAGMLFIIVRNESKGSVTNMVLLGIASGLFVFNRPSDAILIFPIIFYVIFFYRDQCKYYLASAFISGLPFLIYNLMVFGTPMGGYIQLSSRLGLSPGTLINYIGLLIAPNKGLLVFSPILVLAVLGYFVIRKNRENRLFIVLICFIPVILADIAIYALFDDWIGGYVYGPRYLTSILPVLAIYVCLALDHLFVKGQYTSNEKNMVAGALAVLIVISVLVQFIGVSFYIAAVTSGSISAENYAPWSIDNSIIVQSVLFGSANLMQIDSSYDFLYLLSKEKEPSDPGKNITGPLQRFNQQFPGSNSSF